MPVGNQFEGVVFIDTQRESINAVEGAVSFPADLLRITDVRDGDSLINFWIEPPHGTASGTISFSGIFAGGYRGEKGKIFSIIFAASREGRGAISTADTKALLNDGNGTAATAINSSAPFFVSNQFPASTNAFLEQDSVPPEPFAPQVGNDPSIFNNQYFLVFGTTDKGVGVDYYEVAEIPSGGKVNDRTEWRRAESPYLLADQTLHSDIYVRATDKSGNSRVANIPARFVAGPNAIYVLLATGAALGVVVLVWIWRRRKRAR